MFDQRAADDRLADMADRRERGLCVVAGCQNSGQNRTLDRCSEHGGVAKPLGMGTATHVTPQHRQGLHSGWYSREG